MNYDEFTDQYLPQQNHLEDNASFNGWMYETYGPEVEYVLSVAQYDPKLVATIVEGDDGELYLIDGMRFVNRLGYMILTKPVDFKYDILID